MDISKGKRTNAVLEEVKDFIKQPSPRKIPKDLLKSANNRFIKSLLLLTGFSLFLFMPGLFAIIAIVNKTVSFGPGVIPAYILYCILFCVFIWGLSIQRKTQLILENGKIYEGRIVKIGGLPLRMPSTSYYYISVEFTDELGEKHKVWDAVENITVDYYYKALSNDDIVELMYTPKVSRNAILGLSP